MIPNAEHWRTSIGEAQALQRSLMGKLPGFAIPRVVCDVPLVGKRLLPQPTSYGTRRGLPRWRRASAAHVEGDGKDDAAGREYAYYDPIDTLPPGGQEWWMKQAGD